MHRSDMVASRWHRGCIAVASRFRLSPRLSVGGEACVCNESCLDEFCHERLIAEKKPIDFVCTKHVTDGHGNVVISNESDQLLQVLEVQLFSCSVAVVNGVDA